MSLAASLEVCASSPSFPSRADISEIAGLGQCLGGVCTLQSCEAGYTAVAGVCTAINTTTDVLNWSVFLPFVLDSYFEADSSCAAVGLAKRARHHI